MKNICRLELALKDEYGNIIDLVEWEKQIRADAIDEFAKAIEEHQTRQDSYLDPPYVEMGLDMADVLEVAEKLKEQK